MNWLISGIILLSSFQLSAMEDDSKYEKVLFYAKGLGKRYETRAVCLNLQPDHCANSIIYRDTIRKGKRIERKIVKKSSRWVGRYFDQLKKKSGVNILHTSFTATHWAYRSAYWGPGLLLPVTPFLDLIRLPYALPMAIIRKKYRKKMLPKVLKQVDDFLELKPVEPIRLRLRYFKDINDYIN